MNHKFLNIQYNSYDLLLSLNSKYEALHLPLIINYPAIIRQQSFKLYLPQATPTRAHYPKLIQGAKKWCILHNLSH